MARWVSIVTFIMLVGGCIPYSENPITEPRKDKEDTKIIGSWFWHDGQERGYIHIGKDEDPRLMRLVMSEFDKHGQLKVSEFLGHTSILAGNTYLNLKWVRPTEGQPAGYLLLKYVLQPDALGIAVMSSGVVEEAIQSGALKGTVKEGHWASEVHITAAERQLQQFIRMNDSKLFPEIVYLRRVKLPAGASKPSP